MQKLTDQEFKTFASALSEDPVLADLPDDEAFLNEEPGSDCKECGAPVRASTGFALYADDSCEHCLDPDYDPSPICNCGTCTPPDFTCIRKD